MKVGAGGDAGLMSLFRCLEMKDQQYCLFESIVSCIFSPTSSLPLPYCIFCLSVSRPFPQPLPPLPPLSLLPVPAPSLSTVPRFDPPEGVSWEGEKEGRGAGVAGSLAPLLWDDERA